MANKWTSKPPLGTPIIRSWRNDPQYLKLWLPFQEGGGGKAYDLSGNRNHGTLTNMANPPTATSGWAGSRGLSFDGVNDYVEVSTPVISLGPTNDISLSIWAKGVGSGWGFAIVNRCNSNNFVFAIEQQAQKFQAEVAKSMVASQKVVDSVTYTIGEWYNLVAVGKNQVLYFYKNGNLVGSVAYNASILSATASNLGYTLGTLYQNDVLELYFNGLIDDVRIYNRALSAGEVGELFVDRWGDFKPPHIFYYFLNTGTLFKTTIQDTITVTESLNKQANIQKSDSISLAEMISLAVDIEKQDSFAVVDSVSYFITRFQTIIDTIEITDLISRQSVELVKSDSVTITDSLSKDVSVSVSDSVDVIDSIITQVNLIISDSVSVSDGSISKQISININDIITIIDSLSKIIDINLADSVEIIENLTKFITYIMPVTDTIEIAELISGQSINIVRSDTIEIVDNLEKSISLTLEDNFSLTDIINLLIQLNLDGDSFSITVADPVLVVATRRFRITVNIKKGQGSNILKKGQATIEKL